MLGLRELTSTSMPLNKVPDCGRSRSQYYHGHDQGMPLNTDKLSCDLHMYVHSTSHKMSSFLVGHRALPAAEEMAEPVSWILDFYVIVWWWLVAMQGTAEG